MDFTEEWRNMAEIVVTKLKSDLEKAPTMRSNKRNSASLNPAPEQVVTLESTKGWEHQVYLPEGLEEEAPRTVEEVAM